MLFFKGKIVGGDVHIDNEETFDLKFFSKDNLPPLFTQMHEDAINDFFDGKIGAYR